MRQAIATKRDELEELVQKEARLTRLSMTNDSSKEQINAVREMAKGMLEQAQKILDETCVNMDAREERLRRACEEFAAKLGVQKRGIGKACCGKRTCWDVGGTLLFATARGMLTEDELPKKSQPRNPKFAQDCMRAEGPNGYNGTCPSGRTIPVGGT